MHFTQLAASAALVGSVLAHRPGVVNGHPPSAEAARRGVVVARDCSHNNLLRALIRFQAEASPFCSSYLGGSAVITVTETLAGADTTVDATITETPEPFTEIVTDIGTVTAEALRRRQAVAVPYFISQYANDTRLSSNCACLLGTDIPAGTITRTVTGPATATAIVTATVTLNGTTTTATTFETTTVRLPTSEPTIEPTSSEPTVEPTSSEPIVDPTSSEPTVEPTSELTTTDPTSTSASSEPTATPSDCPSLTEPLIGCVFGSTIISADLIGSADECPALCDALPNCVAYQIGVDEDGAVAYCETLNAQAADAFDEDGTLESFEYCSDFSIYDNQCPVPGA